MILNPHVYTICTGRRRYPLTLAKRFPLQTFKVHASGDYVEAINLFGTTDSYSTQIGEREHRTVKNAYKRTNFVDPIPQITTLERRQTHLRQRADELAELEREFNSSKMGGNSAEAASINREEPEDPSLWQHSDPYFVSQRGTPVQFGEFLSRHRGDPAVKTFFPSLQEHVVDCVFGDTPLPVDPEFVQHVRFPSGRFYEHSTIRINYTTYDIRRARDTINPLSPQHYLMVRSPKNNPQHQYWYAKLLNVLHIDAEIMNHIIDGQEHPFERKKNIIALWVRWLGKVRWGGWAQNRLDLVGYIDDGSKSGSFGFIDPASVVRGSYLIPAFEFGQSKELLEESLAWDDADEGDWSAYYVIRFVDRDMGMRYFGSGIGHLDITMCQDSKDREPPAVDDEEPAPLAEIPTPLHDVEHEDAWEHESISSNEEL